MEVLQSSFAPKVAPLRALDAAKPPSAKRIRELRLSHGKLLADFTVQALAHLRAAGPAAATSSEAPELLMCAREAALLVLWLGTFRAPESQTLCYNVAVRYAALKFHEPAAELAGLIVRSLVADPAAVALPSRAPAPAPWPLATPSGTEALAVCEMACTALGVHLRALEALSDKVALESAMPHALAWLRVLRAHAKENAPAAASGAPPSVADKLLAVMTSALRAVRKEVRPRAVGGV